MRVVCPALLLVLLSATGCSDSRGLSTTGPTPSTPTGPRSYVGLRYGELPAGVTGHGGALVDAGDSEGADEHGVTHVSSGDGQMLWLRQLDGRDPGGNPFWRVRDVLSLPELGDGRTLVYALCSLDGEYDPAIAAVVEEEDAEEFTHVVRAWRADPASGRFREISPEGVRCTNEGYGAC